MRSGARLPRAPLAFTAIPSTRVETETLDCGCVKKNFFIFKKFLNIFWCFQDFIKKIMNLISVNMMMMINANTLSLKHESFNNYLKVDKKQ